MATAMAPPPPAAPAPDLVDIDLRMPGETVQEVQTIAGANGMTPGEVLVLGASLLGLVLAIVSRKGKLIAEYPDGTRSEVELPK
jgi:hypothetical protein